MITNRRTRKRGVIEEERRDGKVEESFEFVQRRKRDVCPDDKQRAMCDGQRASRLADQHELSGVCQEQGRSDGSRDQPRQGFACDGKESAICGAADLDGKCGQQVGTPRIHPKAKERPARVVSLGRRQCVWRPRFASDRCAGDPRVFRMSGTGRPQPWKETTHSCNVIASGPAAVTGPGPASSERRELTCMLQPRAFSRPPSLQSLPVLCVAGGLNVPGAWSLVLPGTAGKGEQARAIDDVTDGTGG